VTLAAHTNRQTRVATDRPDLTRRRLLRGAGGLALGLPFLASLTDRPLRAAPPARPRFAVFVRQANGCAQADGAEPERFWPRQLGPLTRHSLTTLDADRAVSELADFADQLLLVRGTHYAFPDNLLAPPPGGACGHAIGGNQLLTARPMSTDPGGPYSLAMGESVDNRIARERNAPAHPDPLTLYAGAMSGYIDEVLSYRGPMDLRAGERDPWAVYLKLVGITGLPAPLRAEILARRTSVNDLVREQLHALLAAPRLARADRDRLQLHFEAIRELEHELACTLPPPDEIEALAAQHDYSGQDDRMQAIVRLHMNLIALAFACDQTRAATLQIGDGADGTRYRINGQTLPRYHQLSHRIFGDYAVGDPIPDAAAKHHMIDREHGKLFAHLLARLSLYTTETGTLLDDTVAVWCNDLATGPTHGRNNLPWVCAGSCGGALRTGQYIDGNTTHNKFLNKILTAVGLTTPAGDPITNFGDPGLAPGLIDAMLTA